MTRVEILALTTALWTIAVCQLVQLAIAFAAHLRAEAAHRRNNAHQAKVAAVMDAALEIQSRAIDVTEHRAGGDDELLEGDEWKRGLTDDDTTDDDAGRVP